MDGIDLETTVLIIEAIGQEAEDAFKLPRNKDYIVPVIEEEKTEPSSNREGTPFVRQPKPICALKLKDKPYDPVKGWRFGSDDEEEVDFRLSDSTRTGVSRHQFLINYNWKWKSLVLTNTSQHFTMMSSPTIGRDIIVRGSKVILSNEVTKVTVGMVSILIQSPVRGNHQSKFDENLASYLQELQASLPRLVGLTVRVSQRETPLVIYGKRSRLSYTIEKEGDLGSGKFGIVSRALDTSTGDFYAVKKFFAAKSRKKLISEEIKIAQRISHEHIVQIFDVQDDPVTPLLVMEYVEGGDLSHYSNFTMSETTTMTKQQLKAIAYLHSEGISHRDVKPENILVRSRYPEVFTLLTDFGFSTSQEAMQTFCGTPRYLAPEVGKRLRYTKSADIWSIGTVALQYAYSLPEDLDEWDAQDWGEAIHYHARKQEGIFANLLLCMLDLRPRKRPSAEDCVAKLSSSNRDSPSSCSQIRTKRRFGRPHLKKPKVIPSKIPCIITRDARDIFGPARGDLLTNVRLQLMGSEVDATNEKMQKGRRRNSSVETEILNQKTVEADSETGKEIASVTKGKGRKLEAVDMGMMSPP